MSTLKGSTARTRPQKYQNAVKFQNNKYDSSRKTKTLNNMKFEFLCTKCESVILWKIQYKKYKPLTVPSKCIKCEGKTVKKAYHNICDSCAESLNVCAKCGENWKAEQQEEL